MFLSSNRTALSKKGGNNLAKQIHAAAMATIPGISNRDRGLYYEDPILVV